MAEAGELMARAFEAPLLAEFVITYLPALDEVFPFGFPRGFIEDREVAVPGFAVLVFAEPCLSVEYPTDAVPGVSVAIFRTREDVAISVVEGPGSLAEPVSIILGGRRRIAVI
jgi:hypothetical protein